MTAVQLGVFVTPDAGDRAGVLARVELAERAGLDLVGIQDHPYQRRFLETWSLLAFLAARTERVRLWSSEDSTEQLERFAEEVAPAVRRELA